MAKVSVRCEDCAHFVAETISVEIEGGGTNTYKVGKCWHSIPEINIDPEVVAIVRHRVLGHTKRQCPSFLSRK